MILRAPATIALCGVLGLAACTNGNPDSRHTRTGALMGAATGTVVGLAASGGEAKGAMIGAIAGAGIGGVAGSAMDRQASALRGSVSNSQITIEQQGDLLVVRLPQDILFETSSYTVNPALNRDLAAVAANLNQYPNSRAEVVGHTDNTGSAAYNRTLSVRRAQSVADVLVANGVASSRLTVTGRGEDAPIASNLTPEGRAMNRRVEIIIRPNG